MSLPIKDAVLDRSRMEDVLSHGVPTSLLGEALMEVLCLASEPCPRCLGSLQGAGGLGRLAKARFSYPVTYTDKDGPTCYQHADSATAKPIANWRQVLFAQVALAQEAWMGCSDECHRAAFHAESALRRPRRESDSDERAPFAVSAGLRAYAGRWGDDERADSYASGLQEKAELIGCLAYAAASGDPEVRPAWLLAGFIKYREFRWPKAGDLCPECEAGMMVSVAAGTRIGGKDPMIFCPVCTAEVDRRAALTPEQRAAEDEAKRLQVRDNLQSFLQRAQRAK